MSQSCEEWFPYLVEPWHASAHYSSEEEGTKWGLFLPISSPLNCGLRSQRPIPNR